MPAAEFERTFAPAVERILRRLQRANHRPSPRDQKLLVEARKLLAERVGSNPGERETALLGMTLVIH